MNILVSIHSPFVMWNIPDAHVDRLRGEFPTHTFLRAKNDEEAVEGIAAAEVVFSSQVGPAHLAAARHLRWIHSPAAGVGSMLFPEMVASPVVMTNSRGLAADTMAEHVVAVTLALFRRLPLAVQRQMTHTWAQDEISAPGGNRSIEGARVLVVGLGAIGAAVGWRMAALGAIVTGIRRRTAADRPRWLSSAGTPDQLIAFLSQADVVVIAAPQTRDTRGLIGAAELAAMRRDAVLVNVARGRLIDECALVEALRDGTIQGAALDVFAHEPLARDSPLWDLPNVLITPHTSGFRPDHWDRATTLFIDNLRRFERGEALLNVVDKAAGY